MENKNVGLKVCVGGGGGGGTKIPLPPIRRTNPKSATKYDIRHEVDTPVANHFNLPGNSLEENFEIVPIEQHPILGSKTETDLLRLEREAFWIRTLETKKLF